MGIVHCSFDALLCGIVAFISQVMEELGSRQIFASITSGIKECCYIFPQNANDWRLQVIPKEWRLCQRAGKVTSIDLLSIIFHLLPEELFPQDKIFWDERFTACAKDKKVNFLSLVQKRKRGKKYSCYRRQKVQGPKIMAPIFKKIEIFGL